MRMWLGGLVGAGAILSGTAMAAPFAWVAHQMSHTASRIDLATHESFTVPVGEFPYSVAAGPTRGFVGSIGEGTVKVLDNVTGDVVATAPVGSPRGIAVTPDGSKAYTVANEIAVLDGLTGNVLGTVPMAGSPDLSYAASNAAGTRVYVGKSTLSAISLVVIDTATDTVVGDVFLSNVGFNVDGIAVSPDGTHVWATIAGLSTPFVVDATTNLLIGPVPLACEPTCGWIYQVATHPGGSRVYVGFADRIAVVDTATLTEIDAIDPFATATSLAVTPDGTRLYAIESDANRIEIFDTATHDLVGTLLTLGEWPIAYGHFISPGPTTTTTTTTTTATSSTTTTLPPLPLVGTAARTCQDAIVNSWKRFPVKAHKLFASCLGRVLRDAAAGKGTADAATACVRSLDPGDPASALSRTRSAARTQVLAKCVALAPAALGHPCAVGATDMAAVAECVFDAELDGVARTLAAQYGAPCTLAVAAGIDALFPPLCAATP